MTGNTQELEEILEGVANEYSAGANYENAKPLIVEEAKQAITSLIKELMAEAKPEKRTPDYYSDSIDLYSRQCAANSWNKAIDQFEQNLLKALEEV